MLGNEPRLANHCQGIKVYFLPEVRSGNGIKFFFKWNFDATPVICSIIAANKGGMLTLFTWWPILFLEGKMRLLKGLSQFQSELVKLFNFLYKYDLKTILQFPS